MPQDRLLKRIFGLKRGKRSGECYVMRSFTVFPPHLIIRPMKENRNVRKGQVYSIFRSMPSACA
jgi:hypothetical protein